MTLQKKYIPSSWKEIFGQNEVVKTLKKYKDISDLPHLLFVGPPGVGKTACAYVLAKELGVPVVELNASDERGIDVVREKIKTLLFTSGERIILLDEADSLCLHPETEIIVNKEKRKIKEVVNQKFKTLSYDFQKKEIVESNARCIDSGKNFLYRVVLDDGREIICSENQPFFDINGKKKKLKELKPGDRIITFE